MKMLLKSGLCVVVIAVPLVGGAGVLPTHAFAESSQSDTVKRRIWMRQQIRREVERMRLQQKEQESMRSKPVPPGGVGTSVVPNR